MDAQDLPTPSDAWAELQQGVGQVVDQTVTADDAARRANPDLVIPDKIGIDDPNIVAVLDRLGRDLASDPRTFSPGPDAPPLIKRLANLLAAGDWLPGESSQPDLAWAWVRVLFAGFGFELHGECTDALRAVHDSCPFERDESQSDWFKSANSARLLTGWPLCTVRMDWTTVAQSFGTTAGEAGFPHDWLRALAVTHLAKYGRRTSDSTKHWFVYRGGTQDIRLSTNEPFSPLASALSRHERALSTTFRLGKERKKDHHKPSVALRHVLGRVTLASFERLKPVTDTPKDWLLGPHPRLVPTSLQTGLIPVSLKVSNVWSMAISSTPTSPQLQIDVSPLPPSASLFDYDWPDDDLTQADADFASRVPTSLTNYELPFDRILSVFPNAVPPVDDAEGYRALLNAALIAPFIPGCREFPPIYICPHIPTDEGATSTGKSTLAKALAAVYSPALNDVGTIRVGNDGAPSARNILALIERHGTAALDEFLLSKDPDHPMSEAKILNLATGDSVSFGKALSNAADTVRLTAPLMLASKVVRGKIDMFNRSLRIELTPLTGAMTNQTYTLLTSGAWSTETSLHARAAALMYGGLVSLTKDQLAYPPEHYRFHTIRALAVLLLARAENLTVDVATTRIDSVHAAIIQRHMEQLIKSMDTGLSVNAAESGTAMFTYDHLFGPDVMDDDVFVQAGGLGNRPIRDYLRLASDARNMSASRMVGESYGEDFTGSERQLVISLNRSLIKGLANGPVKLGGQRGLDGWHVSCKDLKEIRPKFALERLSAGMPLSAQQSGIRVMPDAGPIPPFPGATP